jgi:hypothetical protein
VAQAVRRLSPWRPGFARVSIHVGFVVDKVALGQIFLLVLRVVHVGIISPVLHAHITSGR